MGVVLYFQISKRGTILNIYIYSRNEIEKLIEIGLPENVAVISFHDMPTNHTLKDYAPVDFKDKCQRLFMIEAQDIDIEILDHYGLTFDTYMPDVNKLAEFIISAKKDGLDIICQCEYGQSRSAACAATTYRQPATKA